MSNKEITPLLNGSDNIEPRDLFWHFPHYRLGKRITPYGIIRSGDWKLIKYYENETFELYNLKEDISETNNLAEERPELTKELNVKLTKWLTEVNAKMPGINPDYKPPK